MGCRSDRFILELPTGSGKGRLCMMILDRAPARKKWLVVVPELIQIENLKKDIEKHGFTHLYRERIEDIICYASLEKYRGAEVNVWLNECHRLSELKGDILRSIKADRVIADSATVPSHIRARLYELGEFAEFTMTLEEAVEIGLLPAPLIHVKRVTLDNTTRKHQIGRQILTDREYSDWFDSQIAHLMDMYEEQRMPWIQNKIKQTGSQRKKFLAECKTEHARDLIRQVGGLRMACFAGSIEQCNELGGKYAVNSKKTKKHNLSVIDRFNRYEIDKIYFNRMGREGMNLEGIRGVMIVQLSSGRDEGLDLIQRVGRSLRHTDPLVYILAVRRTADEKYLNRALENIDKTRIEYI